MTTQHINGIPHHEEEIPGKGKCWVPTKKFTLDDIKPGNKFVWPHGSEGIIIRTAEDRYLFGGWNKNPFHCWGLLGEMGPVTQEHMLNYVNSSNELKLIRYEN